MVSGDVVLLHEPLHLEERAEARVRRLADLLETEFHDDTVLILQFHDVTDGRDGGKLEEIEVGILRKTVVFVEHGDDLPGNDGTADVRIWVAAVFPFRIHDRARRREDVPRLTAVILVVLLPHVMMVGDEYGESEVTRMLHLLDGTDAVVAGQHNAHAVLLRLVDDVDIDSVSIFDSVRQYIIHLRAEALETGVENVGRTHTIDVVISDDSDATAVLDGAVKLIHAADGIRQKQRRVKLLEGTVQILLDLRIRVDFTVSEDARRHLIDVVRRRNRLKIRLFIIYEPFFHVLSFWVLLYN